MFRTKQIGMVAILGLALVLATATVFATTQSAQAILPIGIVGPSFSGNGINPGASTSVQNSQLAELQPRIASHQVGGGGGASTGGPGSGGGGAGGGGFGRGF